MEAIVRRAWMPAALLALLGIASAPGPAGVRDDGEELRRSLQGVWKGERFAEGKGEDPRQGVGLEVTFKDGQLTGRRGPDDLVGEAAFTLSKDGKTIDAVGSSAGYKGKSYLGILKIEGDTLSWCTGTARKNQKRPADYQADPKEGHYLIILKRKKA